MKRYPYRPLRKKYPPVHELTDDMKHKMRHIFAFRHFYLDKKCVHVAVGICEFYRARGYATRSQMKAFNQIYYNSTKT